MGQIVLELYQSRLEGLRESFFIETNLKTGR